MARASDPWDSDLPIAVAEQNQALQALQDAMTVREFLFAALPEVRSANFRVYRPAEGEPVELIIAGTVTREDEPLPAVRSLVMRAKLCGLRFSLSDGVFEALSSQGEQFGAYEITSAPTRGGKGVFMAANTGQGRGFTTFLIGFTAICAGHRVLVDRDWQTGAWWRASSFSCSAWSVS